MTASSRGGLPARRFVTESGIPLAKAFFEASDVDTPPEPPGEFPYTRGIDAELYRKELWHKDLYAGFGNAEDARERYEFLLKQGASGINIALDLPTQVGLDSDDPRAAGEVGKVGLAVDSLADVEFLLENIDMAEAGTIFTVGNCIGPIAAALFMKAAEKQGVTAHDFVLHLQNDPLKEYTGRGTFIFPVEPAIRLAADVVEYAARQKLLHWKPIGICGSQYRWGGASAIEEIAYGVLGAEIYVQELLARGLAVDDFGPLLEMHLAADIEIFEEVAKFRAARRIWAQMMREAGGTLPESLHLRISLYTGGWRLTKQEPLNNSVRITLQALSAVLGGVQHIGTLSIDEALSTPSPSASRLAVRTQQILAHEAKLGDVVDPLGGSYLVEWLTEELERRIRGEIERIQGQGGTLKAIRDGTLQERVQAKAYEVQQEIEDRRRIVVGVNAFSSAASAQEEKVEPFLIDETPEIRQRERLAEIKKGRDDSAVRKSLLDLTDAARDPRQNLMEPIISTVAAYATVGEICSSLQTVFGDWRQEGTLL